MSGRDPACGPGVGRRDSDQKRSSGKLWWGDWCQRWRPWGPLSVVAGTFTQHSFGVFWPPAAAPPRYRVRSATWQAVTDWLTRFSSVLALVLLDVPATGVMHTEAKILAWALFILRQHRQQPPPRPTRRSNPEQPVAAPPRRPHRYAQQQQHSKATPRELALPPPPPPALAVLPGLS